MTPVFNEFIKYINDNLNKNSQFRLSDFNIIEGMFFVERNIIKSYSKKDNKLLKICKINLQEDYSIILTSYRKKQKKLSDLNTWNDLINIYVDEINEHEKNSINLVKEKIEEYKDNIPVILTSTGKDSVVLEHLINKVSKDNIIIFNNSSLDVADTYKLINKRKNESNFFITNPKEGFYQYIKRVNFIPNRMNRACCSLYKELILSNTPSLPIYNKKAIIFLGMRNSESNTRKQYVDEWTNDSWRNQDWIGCLPIRKWNDLIIWLYILKNNLSINTKYKKGYHRVGCGIACPFYTKVTWALDKYWYPQLYDRFHSILEQDFINNNKDLILNCTKCEYHSCWNGGIFREEPNDIVIDEFAKRSNLDKNIAKQYFNKTCKTCDKKIKEKYIFGLNMKYFGRNINSFFCKKCLIKELNKTEKELIEDSLQFKIQGCELF